MLQYELQECLNWNCTIVRGIGWISPYQLALWVLLIFIMGITIGLCFAYLMKHKEKK
jgi:hypothetical protein